MGNRAHLKVYLHESQFVKEELEYYKEFIVSTGSNKDSNKLIESAKNISGVWNANYSYMPDQIPTCEYIKKGEELYFFPDQNYSKEEDLSFENKNFVPDSFLVLFDIEEYRKEKEYKGKMYQCNSFVTTSEKSLERMLKHDNIEGHYNYIKELFEILPKGTLIELEFGEVLPSDYSIVNAIPLGVYFDKMVLLQKWAK